MKQKNVAELLGLSVRQIQRLTEEGVFEREKTTSGTKLYELYKTVHSYIAYLAENQNAKNSIAKDKEIDLKEQKLRAEIALRESQAELHNLKTGIAKGEYIGVEEVRLDYDRFLVNFKKFAMSIPNRVGSIIAGTVDPVLERQIEHELNDEIISQLSAFVVAATVKESEDKKEEPAEEKPKKKTTRKKTAAGTARKKTTKNKAVKKIAPAQKADSTAEKV